MYTGTNCCKMTWFRSSAFVGCCALLLLLQTVTYVTAATDVVRLDQSIKADSDDIYEILEDEQFFMVDKKLFKNKVQVSKQFNVTSPKEQQSSAAQEHSADKAAAAALVETTTDSVRTSTAVHHAGITSHASAEHDEEFASELLDDYLIFNEDREQVDRMEEQRREQERDLALRVRRQAVSFIGSGVTSVDVVLTLNYPWNANLGINSSTHFQSLERNVVSALTNRLQSLSSSVVVTVTAFRQWGTQGRGTIVDFTVSFPDADTADRVGLARQMLDIKSSGLTISGTTYTVLTEPTIEDDLNVPKPSICYVCRKYQKCINTSSTEHYCQTSSSDFFTFGRQQTDLALENNQERYAKKVEVPAGIPVVDQTIKDVWVSGNGLISFDQRYGAFNPKRLPHQDRTLMCGFWSNMQLVEADPTSSVWYHAYIKKSQNTAAEHVVLTEANNAVELYGGVTGFSATFVLVVTYEEMPPDRTSLNTSERVNFQMALISDGSVTYGMFIYASGGMQWDEMLRRRVVIGYLSENLGISTASPDTELGNTNRPGVWFFKLGELPKSPKQKCLNWYNDNLPQMSNYFWINRLMPRCPCNYMVAFFTNFWIPEYTANEFLPRCFITPPFYGQYGKRCCYTRNLGYETNRPDAGSFLLYHPWVNPAKNHAEDVVPKKHCCKESNLCELYYNVRPTDTCQRFFFFFFARGNGDPHITTLDGQEFAFNAIGEYTLIHIDQPATTNQSKVMFDLQARTCQARSSQGELVQASVFCGFVAKGNNSDTLQVELNMNGTGLIVYVNNQDLTLQFQQEGNSFIRNVGEMIIRRSNDTIRATFQEGININITVQYQLLLLSVGVSDDLTGFSGLLGNMNGNSEDDYIFPNGTILPANTSERVLLEYGKTWALTDATSLFTYRTGYNTSSYTNDSFQPIFLSEVPLENRTQAEAKCGGTTDIGCIFDFIATKNEELALGTKQATDDALQNKLTANNTAPYLSGPTRVNATLGVNTTIQLSANDTEGQPIRYNIINKPSSGFTFDNQTETVVWRPADNTSTMIEIAVTDSAGAQSESLKVEVVLCSGCNGQGHCDFGTFRTQTTVNEYFKQAVCMCDPYHAGDDCELDLNACEEDPCAVNTICTDFTVAEHKAAGADSPGYNCSACPNGYITNTTTRNCYDIDECATSSPCSQKCYNVIGSFYCACDAGYRLAASRNGSQPTVCSDIDECTEGTCGCEQYCTNTAGSYVCSCYEGFTLNATNNRTCTKNPATDPCANLANTCEYSCKNVSGTAVCQCPNGYTLAANGYNCTDVNECNSELCSQNCNNTVGSYSCSCYVGYYLDADKVTCKTCEENKYGVNCQSTCECKGRGTCNHVRGCQCNSAWTGPTCSQDVNECLTIPNACPTGQTCTNTNGSYVCDCPKGYQKVNSTCVDIDECADPTLHNCPQVCINGPGSFVCSCRSGYTYSAGNNSCDDINECAVDSDRCTQGCVNFPGSANCECRQGFILADDRKTCLKERDPCAVLSDSKNCSYGCEVSQSGVATCFCQSGYEVAVDGVSCVDTNECNNQTTNKCTQKCDNSPGSYVCSCSVGYSLSNNERDCVVCDPYHWGENCANNCSCNPLGTTTCDSVTGCVCKQGWLGVRCELDRDECSGQPCQANAKCTDTAGSYRCDCLAGYTLNTAANTCNDVDECANNPCDQNCTNKEGSYTCSCASGFNSEGDTCVDIDECLSNPCDQECRNTVGGFACECSPGFLLNTTTRTTCYAQTQCFSKFCQQSCRVVGGNETCYCSSGYTQNASNSSVCDDVDECTNNPCINGSCTNSPGAFICTCPIGSKLLSDGVTCQPCAQGAYGANCASTCTCNTTNTESCDVVTGACTCKAGWTNPNCNADVNECLNATVCSGVPNSSCVNSLGSHSCVCNSGFFTSGGVCYACDDTSYGKECKQTCSCVRANTLNCNDINGTCQCKASWTGANCSQDVDECNSTAPVCNQSQFEVCRNFNGGYSCDCVSGYHRIYPGDACTDMDECVYISLNTCNKTTEVCVNTPGSFNCSCLPGFQLTNNVCADLDECALNTDNCTQQCTNTLGSYNCSCNPGYTLNADGFTCDDINECSSAALNNCTTTEDCMNTVGGFTCACKNGYTRASSGQCFAATIRSSTLTITLDFKPAENLSDKTSAYYNDLLSMTQTSLRAFFRRSIGVLFHDFVITDLRSGSVIVGGFLQINDNGTSNVEGLAAKGVEDLVEQAYLLVNGTNQTVSEVQYNGQNVSQTLSLCETFSLFKNCTSKEVCQEGSDGVPNCRVIQDAASASYKLIIGLSVGIPLFFIVIIIIAVLVYMCVKRRRERQQQPRAEPSEDRFRSVFASQIPTKGSWGAARQYQMYTPDTMSVATSESSGEGQLLKGRLRGRADFQDSPWYDNRGTSPDGQRGQLRTPRDGAEGATSNFSWEYMFRLLEPYRTQPLEIQRPAVEASPNPAFTPRRKHPDSMA